LSPAVVDAIARALCRATGEAHIDELAVPRSLGRLEVAELARRLSEAHLAREMAQGELA